MFQPHNIVIITGLLVGAERKLYLAETPDRRTNAVITRTRIAVIIGN